MADERGSVRWGRTGAYDGRTAGPWIALLLVLLLLGVVGLLAPHVRAAPAFALTTTGAEAGAAGRPQTVSLAGYAGRAVVLDFMAVGCTPCRAVAHDVMRPLWVAHANDTRVALLSIDAWADPTVAGWVPGAESTETLTILQRDAHLPWPHALDTDHVAVRYGADELPHVVVVSPRGLVILDAAGVPTLQQVQAALAEALAK